MNTATRQQNEHRQVEPTVRLGRIEHGARRQQRHLLLLHDAVDRKREQRRDQQHHRDHRALEVLLADHLLVDVEREHVVLAANHLGHAEVGDGQVEHDERGRDQAVAGTRHGHRGEDLPFRRTQRDRLVQPGIRDAERDQDDHRAWGKVKNTDAMTMPIGP